MLAHMVRILRSTTLLLTFVAMQLTLLGAEAACTQSVRRQTDAGASSGLSAAQTSDKAMGHDCGAPARESQSPTPDRGSCAQMIVCALTVDSPTAHTVVLATSAPTVRVDGLSVRTPPSFVLAPELPPPRV